MEILKDKQKTSLNRTRKVGVLLNLSEISKLSMEEIYDLLYGNINFSITLDENSIDNLMINKNRGLLEKASQITISVTYDYLSKNKNKIKEINKNNKKINIFILEDYQLYPKDSNVLNDFEVLEITLPFQYAMWLDLNKINNKKVEFRYGRPSRDRYTTEEMIEIKKKVLEIINSIYSNYSNLNEYEKLYLAFKYALDNWEFSEEDLQDENGNFKNDEYNHPLNSSLFNILNTQISVCHGMSGLFTMILNNPIIRVNANMVGGSWNSRDHYWINTVIDNKVYENCLTAGGVCDKQNAKIFTKLNSSYIYGLNEKLENYKFLINKKLGLPLEYSEIPNAREKLSISTELKNKNNTINEEKTKKSNTSSFASKYEWGNYSDIVNIISLLPCNVEDKYLLEEYIYRAIKLKFITQSNIDNVINNIQKNYQNISINDKTISIKNRTNPYEAITKMLFNSNYDMIIEDYQNNISKMDSIEIKKGWEQIEKALMKVTTYLINYYPNSLTNSLNNAVGNNFNVLYLFGIPLKDCGCKENITKDKIIKDLIRKRFDSDYKKNIIKEYSVNNPKYPNMHKDFYEMIKTIYYMFTNENNVLASTYKIKLEMLANKYRDYRGIPDSDIDYINLSRINKISR